MVAMKVSYDEIGDILYIEFGGSRQRLVTHEAGDGVLVQVDDAGSVRVIEVWNFRHRTSGDGDITIPVEAVVRRALAHVGA